MNDRRTEPDESFDVDEQMAEANSRDRPLLSCGEIREWANRVANSLERPRNTNRAKRNHDRGSRSPGHFAN